MSDEVSLEVDRALREFQIDMDQETREQVGGGLYRSSLLSSNAWLRKAEDLLGAAALLDSQVRAVWKSRLARVRDSSQPDALDSGVLGVHLMLVSYGIENLFKAALVKARKSELTKELERRDGLPNELKTHALIKLAKSVQFNTTLEEEALLRKLARGATWSGRYPIPVDVKNRSRHEIFSDGKKYSTAYNLAGDIDDLKTLVARIRQQLKL